MFNKNDYSVTTITMRPPSDYDPFQCVYSPKTHSLFLDFFKKRIDMKSSDLIVMPEGFLHQENTELGCISPETLLEIEHVLAGYGYGGKILFCADIEISLGSDFPYISAVLPNKFAAAVWKDYNDYGVKGLGQGGVHYILPADKSDVNDAYDTEKAKKVAATLFGHEFPGWKFKGNENFAPRDHRGPSYNQNYRVGGWQFGLTLEGRIQYDSALRSHHKHEFIDIKDRVNGDALWYNTGAFEGGHIPGNVPFYAHVSYIGDNDESGNPPEEYFHSIKFKHLFKPTFPNARSFSVYRGYTTFGESLGSTYFWSVFDGTKDSPRLTEHLNMGKSVDPDNWNPLRYFHSGYDTGTMNVPKLGEIGYSVCIDYIYETPPEKVETGIVVIPHNHIDPGEHFAYNISPIDLLTRYFLDRKEVRPTTYKEFISPGSMSCAALGLDINNKKLRLLIEKEATSQKKNVSKAQKSWIKLMSNSQMIVFSSIYDFALISESLDELMYYTNNWARHRGALCFVYNNPENISLDEFIDIYRVDSQAAQRGLYDEVKNKCFELILAPAKNESWGNEVMNQSGELFSVQTKKHEPLESISKNEVNFEAYTTRLTKKVL